ncbi:Lytic transglycosylase [Phytophthora infestans]|uniref:Lytic transglycosylase n=1 Tax=Phytophthora infestans TaxID=4787 RepID=A0A833WCK3_PHYIN|nr:Lytic transglycosylase [Phytophthora infestans]
MHQQIWAFVVLPAMALAGGDTYFTGDATSYTLGEVSAGNCNFMYNPGVDDNYAALNSEQWDSTLNCGRCAEVSCDDDRCSDKTSSQIVYIVDRCPECKQGDLDLSPAVFEAITGSDPSRYRIKWKFVDCPVSGNIEYCTKSGRDDGRLVLLLYFLLNGGSNVDMSAVSVELTSVSGETITETLSLTADECTEGTSNFGASTTQQSSTQQSSTQQGSTSQTSPSTTAPTATTATPSAPSSTPSADSSPTQQNEVNKYFNTLKSSNSSSGVGYQAGKVTAADDSGSDVSILQSSEAGVDKTPSTQQTTDTDDPSQTAGSDTKRVTTKTEEKSSGTSPVLVALVVLAAVGGIALVAVAYSVKKKKLDDKRIDRDENLVRSFDTFSSPLRINETIAKI